MAMFWTAVEHVRGSAFASAADPAIIGIDRDVAAAVLCGLASVGLIVPKVRGKVAVAIVLGGTYALSVARLARIFGPAEFATVGIIAAALFLAWPRLTPARDE